MSEARVSVSKIAVAPFLSGRNGAAAIEFYKAAFGAEVLFRHDAPDGAVVCEIGVGEGVILGEGMRMVGASGK